MHCFSLLHAHQVSSGLERGGFTFQGDIHGKDFGKFKLERQGKCSHVIFLKHMSTWPSRYCAEKKWKGHDLGGNINKSTGRDNRVLQQNGKEMLGTAEPTNTKLEECSM